MHWIGGCILSNCTGMILSSLYRGPAPFHRLTPNKRFEPVFSTVIRAVCSLFNRILLLTDLMPVHLLYCGQTVMIGCNHTSFEWTRAVRHIYGILRHMQGLYWKFLIIFQWRSVFVVCESFLLNKWLEMITTLHSNTKRSPWKSERESFFVWIVPFMVCCLYVWMASTRELTCTSAVDKWFTICTPLFSF